MGPAKPASHEMPKLEGQDEGMEVSEWELAWSSEYKKWYFQDRVTGVSTWRRPKGCKLEFPEDPEESTESTTKHPSLTSLPEDWGSEWDPTSKQYYYYNFVTQERTWNKPGQLAIFE